MPVLRRLVALIMVVAALAISGTAGTYVVRPGDTLSAVAGRLGVNVGALAQANGITDPNRVFAGQTLTVPGAAAPAVQSPGVRVHVVAAGETLTGIAARYGTTIAAIVQANEIGDPNHVRIEMRLRIPDVAPSTGLPQRLVGSPERLALMPYFDEWADANGLPRDLVKAVAWLESGWQNSVISPAGAIGIGQLLPSTAAFVSEVLIGVELDPTIPEHNIRMTARYLRYLLVRTNGEVDRALAGYFQGLGSVATIGRLPSTIDYIAILHLLRPRFV